MSANTNDRPTLPHPPADFYDPEDADQRCFLCDQPAYQLVYEVTHFGFPVRFQRCRCGIIKQTPMPNQDFFDWFFNSDVFLSAKEQKSEEIWGYYDYLEDEPSRLATSKNRLRRLKELFPEERALDVMKIGPSTGTFLYLLRQLGHNALGCDVSSRFVEHALNEYGVPIDQGRFEKLGYEEQRFDVILLFNVIENIPNQMEFLRAVFRTLEPGGRFVLNYVDIESNWLARLQKSRYFLFRPPICYIFSARTIEATLEKAGFRIEKRLRDIRYMTLEKILTLLRWKSMLAVFRLLRLDRLPFPVSTPSSHILVVRKPS